VKKGSLVVRIGVMQHRCKRYSEYPLPRLKTSITCTVLPSIRVTTQVPKITIGGLHYAGTTQDMGHTVTKQGI